VNNDFYEGYEYLKGLSDEDLIKLVEEGTGVMVSGMEEAIAQISLSGASLEVRVALDHLEAVRKRDWEKAEELAEQLMLAFYCAMNGHRQNQGKLTTAEEELWNQGTHTERIENLLRRLREES
jgi:hypothetical protein